MYKERLLKFDDETAPILSSVNLDLSFFSMLRIKLKTSYTYVYNAIGFKTLGYIVKKKNLFPTLKNVMKLFLMILISCMVEEWASFSWKAHHSGVQVGNIRLRKFRKEFHSRSRQVPQEVMHVFSLICDDKFARSCMHILQHRQPTICDRILYA